MSESKESVEDIQEAVPSADAPKRVRLPEQTPEEIERIRGEVGLGPTIQRLTNGPRPGLDPRRNVSFDARSPFLKSNEK